MQDRAALNDLALATLILECIAQDARNFPGKLRQISSGHTLPSLQLSSAVRFGFIQLPLLSPKKSDSLEETIKPFIFSTFFQQQCVSKHAYIQACTSTRYTDTDSGGYGKTERGTEPRKGESLPVWKNSKRKDRCSASRRIRGGFREELSSATEG